MADSPTDKLLKSIQSKIIDQNKEQKVIKDLLDANYRAFPAEEMKNMTKEQREELKEQRKILKTSLENDGKNNDKINQQLRSTVEAFQKGKLTADDLINSIRDGNSKFFGVDFPGEQRVAWQNQKEGYKNMKEGWKQMTKALSLDKIGKKVGGFWDFLKKLFVVGLTAVGFIKFLDGWSKADKWFGENAGIGERISSALANVVGSFIGLEEGERISLAKKINDFLENVGSWLSKEFSGIQTTFKKLMEEGSFSKVATGITKILNGEFLSGLGDVVGGLGEILKGMWDSSSTILNIAGAYFGVKAAFSIFSAIGRFKGFLEGFWNASKGLGQFTGLIDAPGGKGGKDVDLANPKNLAKGTAMRGLTTTLLSASLGIIIPAVVAGLVAYGLYKLFALSPEQDETNGMGKRSEAETATGTYKDAQGRVISELDGSVVYDPANPPQKITREQSELNSLSTYQQTLKKAMEGDSISRTMAVSQQTGLLQQMKNRKDDLAVLSRSSTYDDYMKNLEQSNIYSKELEAAEAKAAMEQGIDFKNFQSTQINNNSAIIAKLRPAVTNTLSFAN